MYGDSRLTVLVLDGRSTAQLLLAGEVDLGATPMLEQAVASVLRDSAVRRIELDVALVRFCDAGGLSALLASHRLAALRQVPLYLIQVRATLQKVLDAAGLDELLARPPD
ncbi:STAS domain-containing protein [Streptacidiphilus carbonis]|uniref:STAS domain-containing protein n=1 Tax=Streptacidiphilus carbonis TaxID=105422 RepID=UPI00069389F3|nr:STAS domain-containing protein [Streptacidiphilus carbonis]